MKALGYRLSAILFLVAALAACGGGREGPPAAETVAATTVDDATTTLATMRRRALAMHSAGVAAAEAARQLMDWAEQQFPQYFPSHAASQHWAPFEYRSYASTGVVLGVAVTAGTPYVEQGVYVMGGAFGAEPLLVGRVGDFITPTDPRLSFALASDKLVVQQGGSSGTEIVLARAEGFVAGAEVSVSGLPAGVTARPLRVAEGGRSATLVLDAQASAPHSLPTTATVTLRADDVEVSRTLSVTVRGPAGSVDTSFAGGVNLTPVDIAEDYANAVAVQADGKVLVVGSSGTAKGTQWSVLRYGRDGGLDTSFGQGGKLLLAIGTRGNDVATAVVVQADGRIVVAGSSDQGAQGHDFAVARLLPDGRLDPVFGNAGKVTVDLAGDTDRAWALALQADGFIVVGGQANTGNALGGMDFALVRLTPGGQLDPAFGQGGRVISTLRRGNGTEIVRALALPVVDGEQRILAVGGEGDFMLARYRANGALDNSFGAGGKVISVFNDVIGSANAVTLLPDGRAVVVGHVGHRFAAIQVGADGLLDASFGSAGRFQHNLVSNWNEAQAVVRQADGRLVLAGWAYSGNGSSGDFAAIRLSATGQLDPGFGAGGIVITPAAAGNRNDQSHALVLQADERVPTVRAIQAGEANGGNHDVAVLRLWL